MVFVISLIITVTSFMFILYIEKKVFNPNGTTKVYVVKEDKIDKGYVIDEKNFDDLFKEEERRTEQVVPNSIESKEEAYNSYLKQDMYKNEILSLDKKESVEEGLSNIEDKREISIKASDIAQVVGGQLREGDFVDVITTYSLSNKVVTETKASNAYIYKTYSSDGSEIKRSSKDKPATTINLVLSATDASTVENAMNLGKIKLVKVIDKSEVINNRIESEKR